MCPKMEVLNEQNITLEINQRLQKSKEGLFKKNWKTLLRTAEIVLFLIWLTVIPFSPAPQ